MTKMDTRASGNRFLKRATKEKIRGRQGQEVSPLYRWMMKNFEDISEARQTIRAWKVFIDIACEDGITGTVEDKEITRKTAAKTWARVQRAHAARSHDMVRKDQQLLPPCRQSKDWKPDFVEGDYRSPSPAESITPAKIGHAQKGASKTVSLPTTIPEASAASAEEKEIRRRGRERAEEIIRNLERQRRLKEPGFHRE